MRDGSLAPAGRSGPGALAGTAPAEAALRTDLLLGAAGLASLTPYFALRGGSSVLDSFLALCLVLPLGAAFVRSRRGNTAVSAAVSAAATAGLVACLFAALGPAAAPAALWLGAEPIRAARAGSRGAAAAAAIVSATAGLMIGLALLFGILSGAPAAAGILAALFLIGSGLLQLHLGRPAPPAAQRPAVRDPSFDILGRLGETVTWHDGRGDVIAAVGPTRAVFGLGAGDVAGTGLLGRVHVTDRPAYLKALNDAAHGGGTTSVTFRFQPGPVANGNGPMVRLTMRACADPDGTVQPRVVAAIRIADATDEVEAADAARGAADSANELKGRFLATVSHELRTPLNAIIGFSELLAADHPFVMAEERRRDYATIIRNSGHHLLEVVNTLLDVSRIESGTFAFVPEPFSLTELVDGCCDLMQIKADQAGVTLERRLPAELPDVSADRRACRQILINLVSNAIKFTPRSGTVAVRVERERDRVILSVADDGIGIRESDLSRLGDPFFQAGDLHNRPHEGTGLGLSVVRGLVGLHGGGLVVESGPGLGTTVTVRIPIEAVPEGATARPAAVQTVARAPVRQLERKIA